MKNLSDKRKILIKIPDNNESFTLNKMYIAELSVTTNLGDMFFVHNDLGEGVFISVNCFLSYQDWRDKQIFDILE